METLEIFQTHKVFEFINQMRGRKVCSEHYTCRQRTKVKKINIANTIIFAILIVILTVMLSSSASVLVTDIQSFVEFLKLGIVIFICLTLLVYSIAYPIRGIYETLQNKTSDKYFAAAKFIAEYKINAPVLGLIDEEKNVEYHSR